MESSRPRPDNDELANVLERIADLLATQGDVFRVRAYRTAAETVRTTDGPLSDLVRASGSDAIEALPGIGKSIGALICEYVETGRVGLLSRLEGQVSPEDLFMTLPGIGEGLAARIHDELGIETLEQLEVAAHSGRLATVKGFGPRRARAVRELLGEMLGRSTRARARRQRIHEAHGHHEAAPTIAALLSADAEYRSRAESGDLKRIAPRRFNPSNAAWLPILHTIREGWSITALFSNTWRAHQLKMTDDWVVLFTERDGHELQFTVVTETHGPLLGLRVVRGRERECYRHYVALVRARPVEEATARAS